MFTQRLPVAITLTAAILLGGCSLPFVKTLPAGIQVDSEPQASVYIDNNHAGETNYFNDKLKPGNYVIKLQPLQNQQQSWETHVQLNSGLTTVIHTSFAATQPELSSYILQLEKTGNNKIAELNIVTTPENVIVRLDDQPKGFSPLTNVSLTPGDHKVTLSAPGYKTMNVSIIPVIGHRLTLTAVMGKSLGLQPSQIATSSAELIQNPTPTPALPLAKANPTPTPRPSAKPTPTPKPTPIPKITPAPTAALEKPYVTILTTPTGWLRVRSEPNGLDPSNEVAKVNSGESFKFIESNQTGWYKIEYAPGQQGWVVAQFTKLVK